MYKIMIVDDEPTIRKGLINFIDWDGIECKIVCEADNGISAKELLHSKSPDIIISDIKMPGQDGIELVQHIYYNFPTIKVILLTGYSEFEYAQSAVKYNVVDFVLKPSSTEKIIDAVNKAKKIIMYEQIQNKKLLNLENEVKENLIKVQEKFIRELMYGIYYNKSNILSKINELKIKINNFYVFVYKVDNIKAVDSNYNKKNILIEIKNFISTIFNEFQHYTISVDSKSLATLISFDNDNNSQNILSILFRIKKIRNFVYNFINIPISIGISDMHINPSEIKNAFDEACKCLCNKFYGESNIFIFSNCEGNDNKLQESIANNYIDEIIKCVESGNDEKALEKIFDLFEYQKTSKQPIDYIKTTSSLILSNCSKLLCKNNIKVFEEINSSENIYEKIMQCESIKELSTIFKTLIPKITESLNSINSHGNYITKKILDYINENYQNTISLKMLADVAHVNSSYLSRFIKKKTGTTLTETITRIRIEKAKELLINNNNKTYEIASMVGFEDPSYFSYVFKKYTGLSPANFTKRNL